MEHRTKTNDCKTKLVIMKLLIVNDNTTTQVNGVVTTFANVINELENRGITVKHITSDNFCNIPSFLYPGVRVVLNPWKMKKIVDQFEPTHIHIATEGIVGLTMSYICWRRNWYYTSSFHTRWDMFFNKMFGFEFKSIKKYLKWFHSKSRAVLATTKGMTQQLESEGYKNVVEWSRGVKKSQFQFSDHPVSDKPVVISVGRVSAEKNLEKFCELPSSKYHLRCIGDGPILKRLQQQYPNVEFVGELKDEELVKAYQSADCMVFSSISDTFGLVMIEAMSTGTPTAGYPVQGPLDVIEPGISGYLCENLEDAVDRSLNIPRTTVYEASKKWTWQKTTDIFLKHLVARE